MIHYHGTPITPRETLLKLAGRNFCVSFARPDDVRICHEMGQSVMLDNGAYSIWQNAGKAKTEWGDYYRWLEPWLKFKTTWAIIPDVIDGTVAENDRLIREWPFSMINGAPVWHLDEPIVRLTGICKAGWQRVCFGSSGDFAVIGTPRWSSRVAQAFNEIVGAFGDIPVWIHMLRGMSLSGSAFPFASADSTDVAQNWHRTGNPVERADRWDRVQCPAIWEPTEIQAEMKYPPLIAIDPS